MTKFLNISTDNTLGGNSPSDVLVASQKAIKEYVDSQGGGSSYHPDLFDVKWADHICNDVSWLRADTFSWQSGAVYQAAYQHLVDDFNAANTIEVSNGYTYTRSTGYDRTISGNNYYAWHNSDATPTTVYTTSSFVLSGYQVKTISGTSVTNVGTVSSCSNSTETIDGVTVKITTCPDGHKICLPDQESNVAAIYTATGVAWYYIIDTTNQRFKLPRTQFAFTGIRSGVGGFVEAGLPNITGVISASHTQYTTDEISGCFYTKEQQSVALDGGGRGTTHRTIGFDASRSSSIYGNSDTTQPKATEMYLYFYVGNFTQTAIENTAGLNAELFNGKADLNLENVLANIDFVVESQEPTAGNGYTWYRKYRSGWVEQGGRTTTSNQTITFPIPFADVPNMTWGLCTSRNNAASYDREIFFGSITTTNFISGSRLNDAVSPGYMWHAVGMAAN